VRVRPAGRVRGRGLLSSRECRPPFGVSGLDVGHGGLGGDAEHGHEVDGVGGVAGFVEDAVAAELAGSEPERGEDGLDDGVGDGRLVLVAGGHPGDQQVRVGGAGPAPVPFAHPPGGQGAGELVEVEGVVPVVVAADGQPPGGQVQVGGQQPGRFQFAEAVDRDQGDHQPGHRAGRPVDQPAELAVGNGGGQSPHRGQGDAAGRVAEDQLLQLTQAQMDAFSTRTVEVKEKERELAHAWERRNGRPPNSRELLYIAQDATLQSRRSKDTGDIDWNALAERWDATIGGELADIACAVSNAQGPGQPATASGCPGPSEPGPTVLPRRDAQVRAVRKALALVSEKKSTWTRHELLKQLALVMPAQSRQMTPGAAQTLLLGLADEALSGGIEEVVSLDAPEWPPLPDALRRGLDGRSVYTRPGTTRYATAAQLAVEERLVAQAQTQGAPHLSPGQAAQLLGADAALLEAKLGKRAHDAHAHATQRGLRLDQAAAIYHVLTSRRTTEVIVGPAGTGKTRALAAAAQTWAQAGGRGQVFGTATSQNATNELRKAGVHVAANSARLLTHIGHGRIGPGSLIVVDDADQRIASDLERPG
jgi:hypothetical protein